MKVIFAITTALAATSAVNAAGALRANNRQLEVCVLHRQLLFITCIFIETYFAHIICSIAITSIIGRSLGFFRLVILGQEWQVW